MTKKAPGEPARRTLAFANGADAWGARYVRPGTTTSPELDLWLALGWPEVRFLVDTPVSASVDWKEVLGPSGRDVPAALASRRVRGHAAFMCDPSGNPRAPTLEALADTTPFDAASAATFVKQTLDAKFLSMGNPEDVVLGLEALVGPDVVLGAILEAFESGPEERLGAHDAPRSRWATLAVRLVLRATVADGDAARERLRALSERARAGTVYDASVGAAIDRGLSGPDAARPSAWIGEMAYWDEVPLPRLRETLATLKLDKWGMSTQPRLVMLAGDPAIDLYRAKWSLLADGPRQRELVALFGVLASPRIRDLMEELADKSKAKKQAREWLDRAPPAAAVVKPAPERPHIEVPPIDPAPILAQLDAAVLANDWPDFFELNPEDLFHGMRVIGVRRGTSWGLVFDRLQGCDLETLAVRRWTFGDAVDPHRLSDEIPISLTLDDESALAELEAKPKSIAKMEGLELVGPRGSLVFARDMVKKHALEAAKKLPCARFAIFARAYHAHFGGGLWPEAASAIESLELGSDAVIVIESDAYAHVALPMGGAPVSLPSASEAMRSLADAIASGDAMRFVPGTANTRR